MAAELTDESPMPFGKHRGTRMEEVPASYLLWLLDEIPAAAEGDRGLVARYIRRNQAVLEREAEE